MKAIALLLLCLTFAKADSLDEIEKALKVMDEPYKVDFMDKKPKEVKKDNTTVQIIGVTVLVLFASIFAASYNEK